MHNIHSIQLNISTLLSRLATGGYCAGCFLKPTFSPQVLLKDLMPQDWNLGMGFRKACPLIQGPVAEEEAAAQTIRIPHSSLPELQLQTQSEQQTWQMN